MKLGINAYAWCKQWTNNELDLIDRCKRLELDFIEIPLMSLETTDSRAIAQRLKRVGLLVRTATVLLGESDIASDDPAQRRRGIEYLKACVRATAEMGATDFSGVIYSQHVKQAPGRPAQQAWQSSADSLREVARFAQSHGVQVGLEPVNRYETYLVNTCAQARQLMELIGEPNVRIHLDTYHMNIEEKSFYEATKLAGKDLMHYHLCENDRGIPGTGTVDWHGVFRALGELKYTGYAALESFVDCTDNMNTWVWRQLAPSGEALVQQGTQFIRQMQKEYGLL